MPKPRITTYLGIFKTRLDKLEATIEKARKNGNNSLVNQLVGEAEGLRDTLDDFEEHDTAKLTCPHCGEKVEVDASKVKLAT